MLKTVGPRPTGHNICRSDKKQDAVGHSVYLKCFSYISIPNKQIFRNNLVILLFSEKT